MLDGLAGHSEDLWVLGDSAGGNLALAAAMEWKKLSGQQVQGLGLFSPWLDLRAHSNSNRSNQTDLSPFERLDMVEYASHYLQGCPAEDPRVAPLNQSLSGLSNVYIEASKAEYLYPDFEFACEAFRSQNVSFADRLEINALHGWQLFPDVLPEAKRSVKAFSAFVKSVRANPPTR